MQKTEWNIKNKDTLKEILQRDKNPKIDQDILKILKARGIVTKKQIKDFLFPKLQNLQDPKKLFDIEKAAKRIMQAIKNKEKICIYGDYDVDGITSTSILYLGFKKLGATDTFYYIPIRDEGYGLNNEALEYIKSENADLVITVDCGITSYNEINYANSLGLCTIITDHHNLLSPKVPNAYAVVNPKRLENEYTFSELAGVGVAFMLLYVLFEMNGIKDEVFEYIDLVAIGTIADVMPLIEENRIIVKYGLEKLMNSSNKGLKTLIEQLFPEATEISAGNIGFKVSPIFNAAGRLQDANLAVRLLISNNEYEIKGIIKELILKNIERKTIQEEIFEKVKEELQNTDDIVLISSSPKYHHGVIGIVAAKIVEEYNKPTIIMEEKIDEGIAVASCRSVGKFDITKALLHCKDLLVKFGGHTKAAGFTIKIDNIYDFKVKINEYAKNNIKEDDLKKYIDIDETLSIHKISYEFYKSLELLKPFGNGNSTPIFLTRNVIVENVRLIGEKKNHLSFDFSQKGYSHKNAVWFSKHQYLTELKTDIFYDIVYKLELNEYKGKNYLNIVIEDMKNANYLDDKNIFFINLYNTSFPMKSIFYTQKDIQLDDDLNYSIEFDRISILKKGKFVSKLDDNISRLLSQLSNFYNFKFKIKIKSIKNINGINNVEIIILKDYNILSFKKKDSNIFNLIKQTLIQDFEYDSTTKLILSALYKQDKNVLISKKYINTPINMNVFLNFAMYNKIKHKQKTLFLTNDKKYLSDEYLKEYCDFEINGDYNYCIFDENTYKMDVDMTKFKKFIAISDEKDIKDTILIKNIVEIPENVKSVTMKNIKEYGADRIYLKSLPNSMKKQFKEYLKTDKIILSDDSIYELL